MRVSDEEEAKNGRASSVDRAGSSEVYFEGAAKKTEKVERGRKPTTTTGQGVKVNEAVEDMPALTQQAKATGEAFRRVGK